jgi:hypothetical protein
MLKLSGLRLDYRDPSSVLVPPTKELGVGNWLGTCSRHKNELITRHFRDNATIVEWLVKRI